MSARTGGFVPADQAVRRLAIETLDRPLLVEAGAGTGKTSLLVARLVHALEQGRASMPRIVAISFTEKAAAELRLRLRLELEKSLAEPEIGAPARARLGRALRELDRATLSTIHAFAASILRERPVQARVDPQFRILDALESAQFRREFWDRWVDAELARTSAAQHLRAALLAGVRLEPDLFDLARELELQRDALDALVLPQPSADLVAGMRALRDGVLNCARHAEENCQSPDDEGLRKLRRLAANLEPLANLAPESWLAVFLGEFAIPTTAGRKADWLGGRLAENKAWRGRLRQQLGEVRQQIAATLLHDTLGWLERFRSAHAEERRQRGVLDFQDLLLEARRLVRDDPVVRADLSARIDLLCVDEFQDTDPLQAELVLFLAEAGGPAADWRAVRVGPKLFLVGDPKQSIYRFRRADLEVYERCAAMVVASGGLRLDIVQNFRSRPAVIHWTNGVFAHLFRTEAGAADDPQHVPLVPLPAAVTEAAAPAAPAMWILQPAAGGETLDSEAERQAEAEALAAWIRHALDAEFPVRDAGSTRRIDPGDVAILFTRTSGIELYEAALRAAGLPFQQEGGRLFFRRQEVRDLLHALAAIDDPHDPLSIVAALRSPLFGASDAEIWLHRAGHGDFTYLEPAGGSPLADRLQVLAELHRERHAAGVAGTIARLLDVTEARATFAARPQGPQALANLEQLQRHARRFETSQPAGLREFVRSLREVDEDAPRLAEWAPQEDRSGRVRLLTVHMAKGLEFPCVLLANLSARGSTRRDSVVVDRLTPSVEVQLTAAGAEEPLATEGYAAAQQRERQRQEAEERRLLYVAATRARDYLVVASFHAKQVAGPLRALLGVQGALGDAAFGDLPAPRRGLAPRDTTGWCVVTPGDLPRPAPAPAAAPATVELRPVWERRAAWPAAHARRLAHGGAEARAAPAAGLGLRPAQGALESPLEGMRLPLARLLDVLPPGAEARAVAAAAHEMALAHGVGGLGPRLAAAAATIRRFEASRPGSRRTYRGVRITAALGRGWVEAWLDLVQESAGSWSLVEYALARPAPEQAGPAPFDESPLVWKALALGEAGTSVGEAGVLFLDDGRFLPISELDAKLRALRAAAMAGE